MHKYLFGPVPSRRLGMSLGIDLVPHKVCSLDCVYCEVGKTTKLTNQRLEYIPYDKVVEELKQFMSSNPTIDFMTFSGSGEPTLNSRIGDVLTFVKTEYPDVKTAVLTNGTLLWDKNVRKELLKADVILPSLDAASKEVFEKINRPSPDISFDDYIQGLINLRNEYEGEIWLEILFLKGYNDSEAELVKLKEIIEKIQPDSIQLNTLDRPGTLGALTPLSKEELQKITHFWGLPNTMIIASANKRKELESYHGDVESAILETIARRPCTLDDLHSILGMHVNEINKYLSTLETEGKIVTNNLERGTFYQINEPQEE